MQRRFFGTDGIRGRVGGPPISPDFMLRLGWAAGRVFGSGQDRGRGAGRRPMFLIGKDPRISGYMLESVLESGLSAAGADVKLVGVMPTPGIAYLTRTFRADAGIVISASHNPFYDNGVKFFSADGNKLPDEVELAIEQALDMEFTCVDSESLGKAARIDDAHGRYIEFCKATFGRRRLGGLRIVVDCANGATYQVAPAVFEELGADVLPMGVSPDGLNINDGCGSTHVAAVLERVRESGADLGVAFDGDGDRVIMVDDRGELLDGDELLYIIASHRRQTDTLGGGVVGTLMSNLGLERALESLGVPFERARVGDRYVLERLQARRWLLGGESSGHILCLDLNSTGDGIVSALQVLAASLDLQCSLSDLRGGMSKYPQAMINVTATAPRQAAEQPAVQAAVQAAECEIGQRGRILLRPSGTEPVVRVMVEGEDADEVHALCERLAAVVEQAAG